MQPKEFTPDKLSAAQIAALKKASSVCFRLTADLCQIEAIKYPGKPTKENPFPHEICIIINAKAQLTNYSKRLDSGNAPKAFFSMNGACFSERWQTIANLLKVGDELTLSWIAANNTENMEKAGFNVDELELYVGRGDKHLVFSVGYQISAAASTRMIEA